MTSHCGRWRKKFISDPDWLSFDKNGLCACVFNKYNMEADDYLCSYLWWWRNILCWCAFVFLCESLSVSLALQYQFCTCDYMCQCICVSDCLLQEHNSTYRWYPAEVSSIHEDVWGICQKLWPCNGLGQHMEPEDCFQKRGSEYPGQSRCMDVCHLWAGKCMELYNDQHKNW